MPIYIDGHVHIYPEFPIDQFLEAAWRNFVRVGDSSGISGNQHYVLALTEGKGVDVFAEFKQQAVPVEDGLEEQGLSSSWSFYRTGEPDSLIARKGKASLVLVAGQQIISRENIEFLSLISPFKVEDHTLNLADLARAIAGNGGLPIIPWGVGKWLGARGKVVESLLHSSRDYILFLGDNGNRPAFWPESSLIRQARDLHCPILSGSDPLPLISHLTRPGSFGGLLRQAELSMQHPAASLRELLIDEKDITGFGGCTGFFQFVIDQLRIKIRK